MYFKMFNLTLLQILVCFVYLGLHVKPKPAASLPIYHTCKDSIFQFLNTTYFSVQAVCKTSRSVFSLCSIAQK